MVNKEYRKQTFKFLRKKFKLHRRKARKHSRHIDRLAQDLAEFNNRQKDYDELKFISFFENQLKIR